MEHLELYGRLRCSLLSRRFAFNGSWRVNYPSNSGIFVGIATRAEYDALTSDQKRDMRWSSTHSQGENPWAVTGGSLATALAVESSLGHQHARGVLGSMLETVAAQFRFGGEFRGYPIRRDPMTTPPQRWRSDTTGPMYAAEFAITSDRYDFANAPRDFRRIPRRRPNTLTALLGPLAPAPGDQWALYEDDLEYHRRWEISQDEVFGLLQGLYAINQISGDQVLRNGSNALMGRVADYLSRNGYLLVKPLGGIVGRGAGDSLVGSEYLLGRAFATVLGGEFASQLDWKDSMTRAGYWDRLAGPIGQWSVLGTLASVVANLLSFSPVGGLLSTIVTVLTGAQAAIGAICPDIAAASRDPLLLEKLAKALAVVLNDDVFDPFREGNRDEYAQSLVLYEYERQFRYKLYSQICGLVSADAAPAAFMAQSGLLALNDNDPVVRGEWGRWFDLRTSPLGLSPRGLPKFHPLLTLATACLLLGPSHEAALRDALDSAKAKFVDRSEADLEIVEGDDPLNDSGNLSEDCIAAADYMAGLALAWLHAQRKTAAGGVLVDGFPAPPENFGSMPRPKTKDGADLFPFDVKVSRAVEPAVRLPPSPDTAASPPVDKSITVNEGDTEVDTGITIHYGDVFRITATGSIAPAVFWGLNGPNGVAGANLDPRWPLHAGIDPTNSRWSLLARLNGWFEIGEDSGERRWIYDMDHDDGDAAKRLFLRINDDVPGNGSGAFQARVRVWGTPRLRFDSLAALTYTWVFPPMLRFALRCNERCGAAKLTISVQMPNGAFTPIVGESLGTNAPDVLAGLLSNHAVSVNASGETTVFWLGAVQNGSLHGRNDTFVFRLEVRTEGGYFVVGNCSVAIQWHGEQISCIRRSPPGRVSRILSVGGTMTDGLRWQLSEAEAIDEIARGQKFFVELPIGMRAEVFVARTRAGRKYLRTVGDAGKSNNLLSLSECPS